MSVTSSVEISSVSGTILLNLDKNQGRLQAEVGRVSSGVRPQNAADKPTALAISEVHSKLDAYDRAATNEAASNQTSSTQAASNQILSTQAASNQSASNQTSSTQAASNQPANNTQDAYTALTVADGALPSVTDLLQRLRSLTLQANSDLISRADRQNIESEIAQLAAEINSIAESTNSSESANPNKASRGNGTAQLTSQAVTGPTYRELRYQGFVLAPASFSEPQPASGGLSRKSTIAPASSFDVQA